MAEIAAPPAAPAESPRTLSRPAPDVSGNTFNDPEAFAALDALAVDDGGPPDDIPPVKEAPAKPRDEAGKFAKPEKPAEKAVEKPAEKVPEKAPAKVEQKVPEKVEELESDDLDVEKAAPKELRQAYKAKQKRLAEILKERDEWKSKASKPVDDTEKKSLAEKLAEREQRIAAYEERLRFTDYSQSDEYKEKYQTPFEDAYLAGRARMAGLKTVERKDEETGAVTQSSRQGTAEDFDELMKIGDDDRAADWAVEHFGNKASLALFHRERVQELNGAKKKALEEYRKTGSEREKQRVAQMETFQKNFNEWVEKANVEAAEKYPAWFKPDENDPKGNELLEKGAHLLARVKANGAPVKEGDKPMSHEELAKAVSAVWNKATAFDRVAHRDAAKSKRIKELEAKLAEYEESQPGPGDGKRITTKAPDNDGTIASGLAQLEREYSKQGML